LSVLACGIGLAAEAQTEPNSLIFEMGVEELAWNRSGQTDADKWQPTYVAVLSLNKSDCFLWCPGYSLSRQPNQPSQAQVFIKDLIDKGDLSKEQGLFVGSLLRLPPYQSLIWTWIDLDEIHGRPRQVLLYALSLDDAKKMAQGYWDLADERYRKYVKDTRESIQRDSDLIEKDKKRLAELDEIIEKAPVEFEDLKKKVTYHDANQALEVVPDLDKAIHACTIEIAGIRTKLEWIGKYQHPAYRPAGVVVPDSFKSQLEAMSIEESIALKAAEARLRTATDLRTQAQRYVDLTETIRKAPKEKDKVQKDLSSTEYCIRDYERQLTEIIPPAIPGGKVFIHKVRIAQDQP
jgi:hypothetical protein